MSGSESKPPELLVLPSFIQSKGQVYQLLSEILQIEKFLSEAQKRKPGTKMTLPKTTADLDKFAEANQRNILHHGQRIQLARFLRLVYQHAPVVGLMMPRQVDRAITENVVMWFRSNIHAQALISASINNRLYGGILLRIKHKTYNFSLEPLFSKADEELKEGIINERSVVIDYSASAEKPSESSPDFGNNRQENSLQSSVLVGSVSGNSLLEAQPESLKNDLADSDNKSKRNPRSSYF